MCLDIWLFSYFLALFLQFQSLLLAAQVLFSLQKGVHRTPASKYTLEHMLYENISIIKYFSHTKVLSYITDVKWDIIIINLNSVSLIGSLMFRWPALELLSVISDKLNHITWWFGIRKLMTEHVDKVSTFYSKGQTRDLQRYFKRLHWTIFQSNN